MLGDMRFDLLQSISIAGDAAGANDDRLGCSDRTAWIIDGATDFGPPGLLGARGGAAWIAMEADAAFAGAEDGDVRSICRHVFGRLAARFALARTRPPRSRWELPSAAFLLARIDGQGLELGWLADCRALIRRGDAVHAIGPNAAGKAAERADAAQFAAVDHAAMIEHLRSRRERPDRRVLGVEPAMAEHVETAQVAAAAGDELLMMTDGFAALIDDYAAMTPDRLMEAVAMRGLGSLADELRAIEQADPDGKRFPRYKMSDDASALWLRIAD